MELLGELAEEESGLASERWKTRGAIAFNEFTAKAIESYERAIGCYPDDAEAYNMLALLYERIGDFVRAKGAYERILAIANQLSNSSMLATANGNLGNIAKAANQLDVAERYYSKSLELH